MNVIEAVGITANGWVYSLRGILRPPVREPFFVLAGLELLLLLALGFFYEPAVAPVFAPVVRGIGGVAATHFPEHLWALPEILRTAAAVLAVLFYPFALAVATLRFAGRPGAWSEAFARAGSLLPLGLLGPGLAWTITTLFDRIPVEVALRSFVIRMGLQGVELLAIALLYTLLAYAVADVMLRGRSVGPALAASIHLAGRLAMPTFLLVAVPLALLFPLTFFLYEMDVSETGLAPEAVGLLLALRVVLKILLIATATGGLTDLYLRSTGRRS